MNLYFKLLEEEFEYRAEMIRLAFKTKDLEVITFMVEKLYRAFPPIIKM